MRTLNIRYKAVILIASVWSVIFSGCKDDYFELEDHGGLDARIWSNEGAVQYYLNDTYDVVMPDFPYEISANNMYYTSDENLLSASDGTMQRVLGLKGSLTSNDAKFIASKYQGTKGDNKYYDIARCNSAIKFIPSGTLSSDVKKRFLGQFYALRAMTYFELTRLYGGVPLVLEPQNPDNLTLAGRAKASECFKQIVADLDSAMVNLDGVTWSDATERGKLTKVAAASLKAKALLYWASPQFNPVNDPKHPYDDSRWQTAFKANEEAYNMCIASNFRLMSKYGEIFQKEGTANTEAIIVRSYSNRLAKRGNSTESKSRPSAEGGTYSDAYVATVNMLNAYPMKDGRPITSSPDFDPVLFWQNRDPRFDATIVYNGSVWPLSGKANRRQWTYQGDVTEGSKVKPFYCKRFSSPDLPSSAVAVTSDIGGNGFDWIELRFAEVMLNYAECANETGNIDLAKSLVREIRKRAGIEQGNYDYGLGLAANKDQMRDLIMNERMVEFAFEGKRGHDLRRTRRLHLLTGTLQTLIWEPVSSAKKSELEAQTNGVMFRESLNINDKTKFLSYFKYPYSTAVPSGNGPFTIPEYYYFYPLPSTFMLSTPLLEQTVGWDNGTFDPL